jgi:hypothetical protein
LPNKTARKQQIFCTWTPSNPDIKPPPILFSKKHEMSDQSLMINMLAPSAQHGSDALFKDSQIHDLPDLPNPSYSNGQAVFEFRNVEQDMLAVSQSTLCVPFSIGINGNLTSANCLGSVTIPAAGAGPGAFLNGKPVAAYAPLVGGTLDLASACSMAFKSSSLDLITGINIGLANSNSSIVSENYLSLLNQIKMQVQTTQDWAEIYGPRLMFAPDTKRSITVGETGTGFTKRQQYLYQQATVDYYPATGAAGGTTVGLVARIQGVAEIPLALLHNFFAQLDYPDRGIQWKLNFLFAQEFAQGSLLSAFVFAGAAPTTRPTYTIGGPGGSAVDAAGQSWTGCMLKYRAITLPPAMQARYDAQILDNKTEKRWIEYVVSDTYDSQVNSTSSLKSYQLANGLVRPVRLWAMGFAPGSLASQVLLRVTNVAWSSYNVKIGTTLRYVQPLTSAVDLYAELSQQFIELGTSPDKGSLLTRTAFYPASGSLTIPGQPDSGTAHFACIDLARAQGRVTDQAVSLILDAVRTTNNASDFICIVERSMVCRLDRTRNTVTATVGSLVE